MFGFFVVGNKSTNTMNNQTVNDIIPSVKILQRINEDNPDRFPTEDSIFKELFENKKGIQWSEDCIREAIKRTPNIRTDDGGTL